MFSIPVGFIDLLEQTAGVQALPCKVRGEQASEAGIYPDPLIYLQYFTTFADRMNYAVFKLENV